MFTGPLDPLPMLRRMKRSLLIFMMAVPAAWAGPVEDAARPCLIERLDLARAACLGVLADQQEVKTEGRIARATVDLQAASAAEIAAFEQGLAASQKLWRDQVQADCQQRFPKDKVRYQQCRLGNALARDDAVRATLKKARAQMGLAPLAEVPDEIEVLIPLPGAPAGPDADLRIPLIVPIQ